MMISTITTVEDTPGSACAPIAPATIVPRVRWYHQGVVRRAASCVASVSRSARAARASSALAGGPSMLFSIKESLRVALRIGK